MNSGGYKPIPPDWDEHSLTPWDYFTREPFMPQSGKLRR
jgi:hypothetical protein